MLYLDQKRVAPCEAEDAGEGVLSVRPVDTPATNGGEAGMA